MQVKFKDNCVVVDWSGCGDFSTIFEAIADQAKVVKYQVLCVFVSALINVRLIMYTYCNISKCSRYIRL